jgi:hypothetical protein
VSLSIVLVPPSAAWILTQDSILLPGNHAQESGQKTLFVIDWEACQLGSPAQDLGQMIAEMWKVSLCRGIDSGRWLIRGFMDGYGALEDKLAFRTAIAVGTHLISFAPFGNDKGQWGSPEMVESSVRVGKAVIVNAWNENRVWFEDDDLGYLFS